jgi:acetyl-CoA C-acetyltransferase
MRKSRFTHIAGICTAEATGYLETGKELAAAREGRLCFDGDRSISTHTRLGRKRGTY